MNNQVKGRIISVALLIVMASAFFHFSEEKSRGMGREAFLESQAKRFDTHFTHPHSFIAGTVACTLVFGVMFAVYELLSFGAFKALEAVSSDE